MKALVGAFNQEKALVGAFSVIVQSVVEPMEHYTALLVPVLVTGVAAPRADEDVRVGHLHVEVLGHAATVHRLLVEVLVGAQQTHLRLQIRVLNIEQQVSNVPTQEKAPLTSLSQREILMLMMDTVLLTSSFCMSSGGSSTKSCNMGT